STTSSAMYLLQYRYASRTSFFLFFFNPTATTEIYTLSLHDALPILIHQGFTIFKITETDNPVYAIKYSDNALPITGFSKKYDSRSEEHTSELQSRENLVCRLLLEKKKNKNQRKN